MAENVTQWGSPPGRCMACQRPMTFARFEQHQNVHAKHQFPIIDGYHVLWRPDTWPHEEKDDHQSQAPAP